MIKELNTLLAATREEIKVNPQAENLEIAVECLWWDKLNDVMTLYREYMENLHWEVVCTVSLYSPFSTFRVYLRKTNGLDKD